MNKKAQGLSMNTIIIAALALLVLVILAALLLRNAGVFGDGTKCEEGMGGECTYGECDAGYTRALYSGCADDEICCMPTGG